MFNEQQKKESPILGLVGLGGGIARARGGGSENYWILSKYNNTGTSYIDHAYDVDTDSAGNIIALGRSLPTGQYRSYYMVKVDTNGGILTEKYLGNGSYAQNVDQTMGLSVDSSDNIYVGGRVNDTFYNAKLNSAGSSVTWQNKYSKSGQGDSFHRALDTDINGNVYSVGTARPTGFDASGTRASLCKVNSSGTLQWVKFADSTSVGNDAFYDVVADGAGNAQYPNIFAVGRSSYGSNGDSILICKFTRDGVLSTNKYIGGSAQDSNPRIAVDSSGLPYVAWEQNITGGKTIQLAKFNNGISAVTWERSLNGSAYLALTGLAVDSSGNAFVAFQGGQSSIGGGTEDHIAKYNSSGVLQWQTSIKSTMQSAAYVRTSKMIVDANDNLIISAYGEDFDSARFLVLKLPTEDPIPNGTYGNFKFSTPTATDSAGSSTLSSNSVPVTTPTGYSATNGGLTLGNASLTSALTDL